MNNDNKIMERLREHYDAALQLFPADRIVGIFLYGSQNYGLDTPESDIDTKCVVIPSFRDICNNAQLVSFTHVLENNEHIEFKDIRLMLGEFLKQNMNFVEILFTKYCIVNELYAPIWTQLVERNEQIARYDRVRTVRVMAGMANKKLKGLQHPTKGREAIVEKFGYDPKQLHHMIRIKLFEEMYTREVQYAEAMVPPDRERDYFVWVKSGGYAAREAEEVAASVMSDIYTIADSFAAFAPKEPDRCVETLLNKVKEEILFVGMKRELQRLESGGEENHEN